MFERFTDRARRVVVLAQEEARMLNHNYIGTEHILLGLIHEGEGVAAKALESLGISLEAVRQQVEEIIGQGQHAPSGHIPFTPRAKKVLELSLREALQLGHNYIGTEHILLGLIRESEGVAAKALESLGISLEAVRQQVKEIIGRGQQAPSGHIPFTPRAKKVLELSLREADGFGHNYIGTEHLLLGLIREGSGVAAQVLVKLGADLNRARQQVVQLLHGRAGEDLISEDSPLRDDWLTRVDSLDRRLAAIERWVGLRPDLDDLDQETARVRREKEAAIDRQDFDASVALRDQETRLLAARAGQEREWTGAGEAGRRPEPGAPAGGPVAVHAPSPREAQRRGSVLARSCGSGGQGQNPRKSGWSSCHHTSTTLPMMLEPMPGPQYRLSHESARLSPSM